MASAVEEKTTLIAVAQANGSTNLESSALKDLKKELKTTFEEIAEAKEAFDDSKNAEKKHQMVTSAEKLVGTADEAIKKYKWMMQMMRVSADEARKQEQKYAELER